jgi:dimethylargininase
MSTAIVRGVPATFDRCIRPRGDDRPIDVALASEQHARYCDTLQSLGLRLIHLDADDRYPDCCFVEDTAVVVGDTAIVCEMGARSRRGEEVAVAGALAGRRLFRLEPPATMDGGDVIFLGGRLFVGLTARTNEDAVRQVERILGPSRVDAVPVPVTGFLHLKSACTPIAPNTLLMSERFAAGGALAGLAGFERLIVPEEEGYAANCLSVGGVVIVSAGYRRTKSLIESNGHRTVSLDMSEFRKGGGSLTCLSIVLDG